MARTPASTEIAVIGMACRLPGEADSPEGLWEMLKARRTAWSQFPTDRLNIDGFYHPDGQRQGSISFRGAHFIRGDIGAFDAPFFSITEEDAKAMDPQQRLLLETSYEAIESAGLRTDDLKGSDTSVFVGCFVRDYEQTSLRDMDYQPRYAATGTGTAIMSNRISYFYDLRGASMTVDTGCSGSLVAVHLACQDLKAGCSSIAFAAGAGIILTPNTMMPMTALNFLSPDGKCFTFDARANGYGRGEGVGLVILKRLSDALRDNDPIRAVIKGTQLSQDGRTAGITLPSKDAQVFNIRKVYADAGLDFSQTAYVECHGTGTQAGDFTELAAVSETLSGDRSSDDPILVGSVKPNLGHLEGAAGVAGLIKSVLVLENAQIPPNANFENENPNIRFQEWGLKVPTELTKWPQGGLRRVSLNCFGFGGTNAHAILDEADSYVAQHCAAQTTGVLDAIPQNVQMMASTTFPCKQSQLFVFSSRDSKGILRTTCAYSKYVRQQSAFTKQQSLDDLAYTLGCRRSVYEWKGFISASSQEDMIQKLEAIKENHLTRSRIGSAFKLSFIFCGQGAQWATMGKDLMCFASFSKSLRSASDFLKSKLGCQFDLVDEMTNPKETSRIDQPYVGQPATTALQVALVDLFVSFGVRPASAVGHSSGEIAAAYACSMISRETAWTVAYYRGHCATRFRRSSVTEGSMCAVSMSKKAAEEYLQTSDHHTKVQVACVNSVGSVTLSGDKDDIVDIVEDLRSRDIFARKLSVGIAYHSRHMKLIEMEYLACLQNLPFEAYSPIAKMFSSVTGQELVEARLGPQYWTDNMVSIVQFADAVQAMARDIRPDMVLEMSPHGVLKRPLLEVLNATIPEKQVAYASSMMRNGDSVTTLLDAVGSLWTKGCDVNMHAVVSKGLLKKSFKTLTSLPRYRWDHSKRYWHESPLTTAYRFRDFGRRDLVGAPTPDSMPQEPRWRGFLRVSENPWLRDHQVQKTIVYPAAGIVAMVIEGTRQKVENIAGLVGFEITDMQIGKSMVIPETAYGLEVSLNMKERRSAGTPTLGGIAFEWTIYGRMLDCAWTQHAHGLVQALIRQDAVFSASVDHQKAFEAAKCKCQVRVDPKNLYEMLDVVGMTYGHSFRNIKSVSADKTSCVGRVSIPNTKATMPHGFEFDHILHPASLDSIFQLLFAIDSTPMVPVSITRIFVSATMSNTVGQELVGYADALRSAFRGATVSIAMSDNDWNHPSIVIEGLRMIPLATSGFLSNHQTLCTEIVWEEDFTTAPVPQLSELLRLMAHKYPALSVLQYGGDHRMTRYVLNILESKHGYAPRLSRYDLFQVAPQTLQRLQDMYKMSHLCDFVEERVVQKDAISEVRYHLIISCGSKSDDRQMENLLFPDGVLLKEDSSAVLGAGKSKAAEEHDGSRTFVDCDAKWQLNTLSLVTTRANQKTKGTHCHMKETKVVMLLPDDSDDELQVLKNNLTCRLVNEGLDVESIVCQQIRSGQFHLVKENIVICLMDLKTMAQKVWDWCEKEFLVFRHVQKATKGILWVTRGANMTPTSPQHALVVGLARTLSSEDPEKVFATLDLAEDSPLFSAFVSRAIFVALTRSLISPPAANPRETEYAEAGGKLYIPRLVPVRAMNDRIEDDPIVATQVSRPFLDDSLKELVVTPADDLSREHGIFQNTVLADSQPFAAAEVEIEYRALVFSRNDFQSRSVASLTGVIGTDLVGIVTRVGSMVQELHVGDEVVALISEGALKNRHRVHHRLARRISGALGKCIPSTWTLAYYGLRMRCHISQGQRILVHQGASSHGQAAIQVARILGAEVFTTVSGSYADEQRKILHELCVDDEHIQTYDDTQWESALLLQTGGRMMDIVYGPIKQGALSRIIKKTGTIVEIAHCSQDCAGVERHSSTHSVIRLDLAEWLAEEPGLVGQVFEEACNMIYQNDRDIRPLQHWKVFCLSQLGDAFRHLKTHSHIGATIAKADKDTMVSLPAKDQVKSLKECVDGGTYVLAGGLGGLGRSIAQLLVDNGAENIVFLSRSAKPSQDAAQFMKSLEEKRVVVKHFAGDICDTQALQDIRNQMSDMPSVSCVVQCAAVFKDSLFDKMTFDQWSQVVKPKTLGSLNLVEAFGRAESDSTPLFIFLSSSAGIIGNRGQANYSAGNVFMDALARSGKVPGRAVSLDIGPVLEVGMVADDHVTMTKLREGGFYGIRRQDFLAVVERAIVGEIAPSVPMPKQVVLGIGTGGLARQNKPKDPYWCRTAMYSYMNLVDVPPSDLGGFENTSTGQGTLKAAIAASSDCEDAARYICKGLKEELAAKLATVKADDIDESKSLQSYGVDSLVAVQIRVWALNTAGASLSIFNILSEKSIEDLAWGMAEEVIGKKSSEP